MAGNLKILLVDDNPMILGMLRHELAELAPVTIAATTRKLLVRIIHTPYNPGVWMALQKFYKAAHRN